MGQFRLQISGTLEELRANLTALLQDFNNQGINPAPLRNANVVITFSQNITDVQNTSIVTALNTWRAQVAATTIVVSAEYATSE